MAKELLESAADDCLKTALLADQYEQFLQRRTAVSSEIPAENDDTRELLPALQNRLTAADEKVKQFQCAEALPDLDGLAEACASVKQYLQKLLTAKASGNALTASSTEETTFKQALVNAATEAKNGRYSNAINLLDGAAAAADAADVKKKMLANAEPDEAAMDRLVATPAGQKMLDDIIKALPPTVKRKVLMKAVEKRFGLSALILVPSTQGGGGSEPVPSTTVTDPHDVEGSGKSLKKIYDLLSGVPDSHTKKNPRFDKLEQVFGEYENYSYYSPSDARVVLRCGRADEGTGGNKYAVGLPEITDPNCLPVPDDPSDPTYNSSAEPAVSPPAKYFDWQTLHEAGHAVDDRKGVMRKNMSAYGGWIEHGADVETVAKAVADHFFAGDKRPEEVAWLAKLLSDQTPNPRPPDPTPKPTNWDQKVQDAENWSKAVRTDKNLWDSSSATQANKLGTRVYHEAYSNFWVSYDFAARAQGIAGYQFRAPGEWFAELYAAFESKKLRKAHPAVSWLKDLLKKPNYPNS